MSSLQIGNGNWAVKEDNLLGFRYDETEGVFFPREMTFSRASDGTRVNPDGLIERVPYNLAQYSEELSNAVWTKLFATITSNATTAPNGTLTADKVVEDTTANTLHRCGQGAIAVTSGSKYTFSFYAKAAERFILELQRINTSGTVFNSISETVVNLTNGTISAGSNIDSSSITSVGNGWYRISLTLTAIATGSGGLNIGLCDANGDYLYTGNGVSGAYIWGFQVNEGSTAKDYFPTTNRQDIARIDYSSGTGALLLEPQRTNLMTYSEQFDNAAWTKENATITANSVISPSGLQDADTLTDNTTSGRHRLQSQSISFVSGTTYTYSVFVKKNSNGRFLLINAASGANARAVLNLDTLEITNINGTGAVEDFGNGWYRFSVTGTATITAGQTTYIQMQNSASDVTYVGDGSSFYLWGAQIESGSYSTSYIPTTSASVTRLADSCYKTGVADWIGQTEGTLFVEGSAISTGSGIGVENSGYLLAISDNTINNQISIRLYPYDGKYYIQVRSGGSAVISTTYTPTTKGENLKIAFAYKANDFAVYVNGTQIYTALSGAVPALSAVNFGQFVGPLDAIVNQKQALLFKTRLSNAELATLTTI